jgi:cytidylate kinase
MSEGLPVVAIDGPVAAGKSTVARELARELGFNYVSTGAMYRAVALAVREARLDLDGEDFLDRLKKLLADTDIGVTESRITLNGRDPGAELNAPGVDDLASRLSALAVVREKVRGLQRQIAMNGAVVMEGRDVGTVIYPEAPFKFFLDADQRVRAERRFAQLKAAGVNTTVDEVLRQLVERDQRDSKREIAPLKPAPDAVVIDSSSLAVEAVVRRMKELVVRGKSTHGS